MAKRCNFSVTQKNDNLNNAVVIIIHFKSCDVIFLVITLKTSKQALSTSIHSWPVFFIRNTVPYIQLLFRVHFFLPI